MLPALADPTRSMSTVRPDDHVLVSVVRNEHLRFPYFLAYYRSLGFDRFMFIDNGSTDGTREFLLAQADVTLFETAESYRSNNFGMNWANAVINAHCPTNWVMLADIDELLVWPNSEHESIQELTARLDEAKAGGLFAAMVDMYSDKPFGEVGYVQGMPFLSATPFFHREPYSLVDIYIFPLRMLFGGLHAKNFVLADGGRKHPPIISKVPLLRWQPGIRFGPGAHTVLGVPIPLAPMRGGLLHFKLFDNMPTRCTEELARGEHYKGAQEYRALGQAIERAPNRCFFDPEYSVRYEGTSQLVALNIMHDQGPFGGLPPYVGPSEPAKE